MKISERLAEKRKNSVITIHKLERALNNKNCILSLAQKNNAMKDICILKEEIKKIDSLKKRSDKNV